MFYPFVIIDVFTDRPFGGNQLAVLPDARGLSEQSMQAVAREFNFAESTFVFPPDVPAGPTRVRIFTPRAELMFAGHPTIGTAAALAYLERLELTDGLGQVILEEGIGPVTVDVEQHCSSVSGRLTLAGEVNMPSDKPDLKAIAAVLSLPRSTIVEGWYASVGLPFCFVHLQSPMAVDAAVLHREAWVKRLSDSWAPQVFMFAGEPTSGARLHARMFAPALGIDEDPATGSACAALAGCAIARSTQIDCSISFTVDQGVALGRPSRMLASAEKRAGRVVSVSVGGQTVLVARGEIEVPADHQAKP